MLNADNEYDEKKKKKTKLNNYRHLRFAGNYKFIVHRAILHVCCLSLLSMRITCIYISQVAARRVYNKDIHRCRRAGGSGSSTPDAQGQFAILYLDPVDHGYDQDPEIWEDVHMYVCQLLSVAVAVYCFN